MPRRSKEEERIERTIQGLLKLPENRTCINCNSLGPQYVCTTFWTFICSTCSGVHRGFTHRVKSVSAAKFNAEEVELLQTGGNERAREIYFKSWNQHNNSFPDGRNIQRLREFIKDVYTDRKYVGGRNTDNYSMTKLGPKDDYYSRPSIERSSSSGKNEVRTLKYYFEDKSPRHKPETLRSSSQRSRRASFEIVDDRIRDNVLGSGRRSGRFSDVEAGPMPEDPHNGRDTLSAPVVRPLREILGENIPPLVVAEIPPDNHGRKDDNASADIHVQKKETSGFSEDAEEKVIEPKSEAPTSLIDFDMEPKVSETATVPDTQQIVSHIYAGNSTESSITVNSSKPPNVNSVESLLFELSALAVEPSSTVSEAPNVSDASSALPTVVSTGVCDTLNRSKANTSSSPSNEIFALPSTTGEYNREKTTDELHMLMMQKNRSFVSPGDGGSYGQQSIFSYNQPWNPSPAPYPQEPLLPNASAEKSSEPTNSTKSIEREELPEDLFALGYSSYIAPVPSWQFCPSQGLGYNMQYNPHAMPISAFPNPAKSRNPFDLGNETTQVQPVMPSPHPSTTMFPQWGPYGMAPLQGAYMGQQLPNMLQSRPQRTSSADETAFASLNPLHKSSSAYASTKGPNSFSQMGGNPFG